MSEKEGEGGIMTLCDTQGEEIFGNRERLQVRAKPSMHAIKTNLHEVEFMVRDPHCDKTFYHTTEQLKDQRREQLKIIRQHANYSGEMGNDADFELFVWVMENNPPIKEFYLGLFKQHFYELLESEVAG